MVRMRHRRWLPALKHWRNIASHQAASFSRMSKVASRLLVRPERARFFRNPEASNLRSYAQAYNTWCTNAASLRTSRQARFKIFARLRCQKLHQALGKWKDDLDVRIRMENGEFGFMHWQLRKKRRTWRRWNLHMALFLQTIGLAEGSVAHWRISLLSRCWKTWKVVFRSTF